MLVFALLTPPALLGALLLLGRFEERLTGQLAALPPPPSHDPPERDPVGPSQ